MAAERRKLSLKSIGLTSGITILGICGILIGGAKWFCRTTIVPKIECIAATVDSANHTPFKRDIAQLQKDSDTTKQNFKIIKAYLEVMSTDEQKLAVRKKLSNPTGLK